MLGVGPGMLLSRSGFSLRHVLGVCLFLPSGSWFLLANQYGFLGPGWFLATPRGLWDFFFFYLSPSHGELLLLPGDEGSTALPLVDSEFCFIGEYLRKWARIHARSWRSLQVCLSKVGLRGPSPEQWRSREKILEGNANLLWVEGP